jgi:hypothetical protein
VVIDAVLQTGIAFGIRTRLTLKHDAAAVREDQPAPYEEHTALAELDVVVVLADDPSALRDEEDATRWAVIDVFGDLRRDGLERGFRFSIG